MGENNHHLLQCLKELARTNPLINGGLSPRAADNFMTCAICDSPAEFVKHLSWYTSAGDVVSALYACTGCKSWFRILDTHVDLETHFSVASYTDCNREHWWRAQRRGLFEHTAGLVLSTINRFGPVCSDVAVLDFGCAFGHFLEILSNRGIHGSGVEQVARLRDLIAGRQHGWRVTAALNEWAPNSFEAVTALDSLYYVPDPLELLSDFKRILKPRGVVVLRVTNRTALLRLLRYLRPGAINNHTFGDQLFAFSHEAILTLFRKTNLELVVTQPEKRDPTGQGLLPFMYYRLLPLFSKMGIHLCPGMIYAAVKKCGTRMTEQNSLGSISTE
jgi:SAM-dependent methyltransferase